MGATFSENRTLTDKELRLFEENVVPRSWMYGLLFFHVLVFVIGFFGNVLVCVAVYRNHSMRTVTNYFIANLAVADTLVIIFCLPFTVVTDLTSTWWFGTSMCVIVGSLQEISVVVSILTLTFISIDRWYAICYPLTFRSTTTKAKTAICIIWVFAFLCELPESLYFDIEKFENFNIYFTYCIPTWDVAVERNIMIIRMVAFYFLPLIIISVAYFQIVRILWRNSDERQPAIGSYRSGQSGNTFSMNTNVTTEGQLKSRRKAAKMLVVVVVVFAICYLPVNLLGILKITEQMTQNDLNRASFILAHWLCYANSATNPIIYNFMSCKFRQEFKSAFIKCRQVNRSERQFNRNSSYIYRYRTNSRLSCKSKTEMVPLGTSNPL